MHKRPQGIAKALSRLWRKDAADECPDLPDMWAYWEHTEATVREALRLQEAGNKKGAVRNAS
jgi:hypothetical protein